MTTLLPSKPSLINLKMQAKSLLKAHRNGDASCCEVLRNLKELRDKSDADVLSAELSLASVQHALALEYGFETWAAMKLSVLGRTDRYAFLHLLCGDMSGQILRNSFVPGDVQVWMENFIEGPAPRCTNEEEWLRLRSEYIASIFSSKVTTEDVLKHAPQKYDRLKEGRRYREVLLWFDACLFDQTIMIHLIDRLSRLDLGDAKLSLICPGEFPDFDTFHGFALLTPEQMASLLPTRHAITPAEIELAHNAWEAFTSSDPTDIERVIAGDCHALPYLAAALTRFLEQYPSTFNGLSRLEQEVLTAVASGVNDIGSIYATCRDVEARPYFHDTVIMGVAEDLARAETPLLIVDGLEAMSACSKVDAEPRSEAGIKKWRVHITDIGREVVAGKQDYVRLNGIDRWFGGVHLMGGEALWRWDGKQRKLVKAPEPPVFQSIADGDVAAVKRLTKNESTQQTRRTNNETPIHWAASHGRLEILTHLVESGVDINTRYDAGNTPLILASWEGHLDCVTYLVEAGADIHIRNRGGHQAIHWAAEHGHLDIVKFLQASGADIHSTDNTGANLLTEACEDGHWEIVKYLLSQGVDIESERAGRDGFTPLVAAAYKGYVGIVNFLLESGADVHAGNDSPLGWACGFGQVDIAERLISQGADVNGVGGEGLTFIDEAIQKDRKAIVEILLKHGASPSCLLTPE